MRLNPPAVTGATAAGIGSTVWATGAGGVSMTGSTQPGAAVWAELLAVAAVEEAQSAALELEDPSALSATHGLSTEVCA